MALLTFVPPVEPSPGGPINTLVNTHSVDFGDGYSLESPVGINNLKYNVKLRWNALTLIQAAVIDEFFRQMGGTKPFLYQPFGFHEPRKWICKSWSRTHSVPWNMTADLKETHTLQE